MKKYLLLFFILFSTISVLYAQIGATNNTNTSSPHFGTAFGTANDSMVS